jgi:hypothetical protein
MPPTASTRYPPPPPVVAIASWLLPGLGYLLMGQRKRGFTVGITILLLLVLGLLIGGVRVMEVPGYGEDGQRTMLDSSGRRTSYPGADAVWALRASPMAEVREKPWSIPQVLTGPAALATMTWSVWASKPESGPGDAESPGAISHSRVNEIGVLYTAVAGMLNLLAIIDAASRAEQLRAARSA